MKLFLLTFMFYATSTLFANAATLSLSVSGTLQPDSVGVSSAFGDTVDIDFFVEGALPNIVNNDGASYFDAASIEARTTGSLGEIVLQFSLLEFDILDIPQREAISTGDVLGRGFPAIFTSTPSIGVIETAIFLVGGIGQQGLVNSFRLPGLFEETSLVDFGTFAVFFDGNGVIYDLNPLTVVNTTVPLPAGGPIFLASLFVLAWLRSSRASRSPKVFHEL